MGLGISQIYTKKKKNKKIWFRTQDKLIYYKFLRFFFQKYLECFFQIYLNKSKIIIVNKK